MQAYYFEVEKHKDNSLTFAYIWRKGQNTNTHPPVESFHSHLNDDDGWRVVSEKAAQWIRQNGVLTVLTGS